MRDGRHHHTDIVTIAVLSDDNDGWPLLQPFLLSLLRFSLPQVRVANDLPDFGRGPCHGLKPSIS